MNVNGDMYKHLFLTADYAGKRRLRDESAITAADILFFCEHIEDAKLSNDDRNTFETLYETAAKADSYDEFEDDDAIFLESLLQQDQEFKTKMLTDAISTAYVGVVRIMCKYSNLGNRVINSAIIVCAKSSYLETNTKLLMFHAMDKYMTVMTAKIIVNYFNAKNGDVILRENTNYTSSEPEITDLCLNVIYRRLLVAVKNNDIRTVRTVLPYCRLFYLDEECYKLAVNKGFREIVELLLEKYREANIPIPSISTISPLLT